MPRPRAPWRALSAVLILAWAVPPPAARACPHPCSCYVPTEVHCTFRSLAAVPAGIASHVERINLGFNSIQALSETSFAGLTQLELLMLHGNNIPSIPDGALRDLRSLQVFKFSYNKLQVLTAHTLRGLRSLVRLHLDHNRLEFLHPQAFLGLTSLRLLHLEGNLLRQLHPGTFATLTLLDHFPLSGVRHLYLAENGLRALPEGLLRTLPLLDNLFLQGNPWACDCEMRWLLAWEAQAPGVLKCKKDKAYEGGQLCATCSSPTALRGREIHTLEGIPCARPSIVSPLRPNATLGSAEEEQDEDEDSDGPPPPATDPQAPPWAIALNMTDEHGNTVSLACEIRRPSGLGQIQLNQTESQGLDVNATVALDLECPMTRENYEKLWKLIAYYSEVPVTLHREPGPGPDAGVDTYQYRQDPDDDALYYTGVRARILARPAWVLQPLIDLQLNRRRSTSKKVLLSYRSRFSFTVSGEDAGRSRGRSWVMIEPGRDLRRAQTVLEGSPCQLSCNVKASESPSISWVLPDGSVLKAPTDDPDSRFSILTSGWLRIKSVERADSGVYQCVARVTDETDRLAYRILVQPRAVRPMEGHAVTVAKNPGEPLALPCQALAVPEAQLSWILPNQRIVNELANTSHAYVLPNGTLSIPEVRVGDGGYYRCVAVNQQGADQFTVGVTVSRKGSGRASKRGRRPGGKALARPRGDVVEDEGGSGVGGDDTPTSSRVLHPKDRKVFVHPKEDPKTKKGRRKPKPWKHAERDPEANVAEGRRAFESRRRVNMASKQINPDHWADILARVRGRNVPKGTGGPEAAVETATAPSESGDAAPVPPVASPPSVSPAEMAQTTASAEEFSADALSFGEEEPVSRTASSATGRRPDRGQAGVLTAEANAAGSHLQESDNGGDEFSAKTRGRPQMAVDSQWTVATTGRSDVPYESSTPQILDPAYEESTGDHVLTDNWSTVDIGPMPEPTSPENTSPSVATSWAESDLTPSVDPELHEDKTEGQASRPDTPTPTLSVVESGPAERSGDLATRGHKEEETDIPQFVSHGFSPQGSPWITKGTEENPRKLPEGDRSETVPTSSRGSERKRQGIESVELTASLASLIDEGTVAVGTIAPTPETTWPSTPTTAPPSHKRPHRRKRPHRFRHRHKPTPPLTFAPTGTISAGPAHVPGAKTPGRVDGSLVPTSWGESTVGIPKQGDPVTKATPRRKHGRRPNKHRYGTSTASPTASTTQPTDVTTPHPLTALVSTTVSQRIGDPPETTRAAENRTTPPKMHVSHDATQETTPATDTPVEMEDSSIYNIHDNISESIIDVTSPSGFEVPTAGEIKKESRPSSVPGTESWTPPRTAPPGGPQTDTPVPPSLETLTHPSSFSQESGDLDLPSDIPPSLVLSTREDVVASTTRSTDVEATSRQAGSTIRGRDPHETTPAPVRPETRPQHPVLTPAPVGESATPLAPTSLLDPEPTTTTEPAHLTSSPPPPTSTGSKDRISLNSVGGPEPQTAPAKKEEVTQHPWWRGNELSTPSPKRDPFHVTPKHEKMKDMVLRGPDGHHHHPGGRVQILHQPARAPPRGTARPPQGTTQSPFRYLTTFQPPRPGTNQPGITAYPSRALSDNKPWTTTTSSSPATVGPWRTATPHKATDRGTDRFHGHSRVFGHNNIPDLRDPAGRPPNARVPHHFDGRFPFFSTNRTFSFPQLGVTPKTQPPTSPAPGLRDRAVNPGAYNRIHTQTITHVDFGPPAPPSLPRPRTVSPISTHIQNIPVVYPTRNAIPFVTSPGPPSGSFHPGGSKLFSAGGPPASKFWTLGEKPQIVTRSPQTVTVTAETDVAIPCEATGKPQPFVTWTKVSTGALMTPNTRLQRFEVLKNGTFVIRQVQVQDRGQYVCTAQNLHGVDRRAVLLSVSVQQPQILASHYQDVTVYLGDTIAMECLARGTPAPQISWVFPDRRVWHAVSPVEGRVTLHENRTLSIKEASFADRGVYKCVASNAAGADSLAIRLHVAALPPVIHQEKWENISLPPGLSVHIHCSAKAAPPPSVRWVLRDGTHIRPSQFLRGNLFVFPNGTLYIRNLAPKDSGRYECVAANLVGSARRTVELTVQRAAAANARITGTSPQRTNVHYGGTLRLDCSASGDPWPRILWRLPSKQMIDTFFSLDPRVRVFANGTLVVNSVTDRDAGDYLCVARNKVGDDFVVLRVNVVMRPAKIEQREANDHRVLYGGDLKVDCVASGLPNPEISWSLPDGSLVNYLLQSDDPGARTKRYVVFNNGTLYFNEVGLREEGDYTCVAENQVGKDEMTVRVKVMTAPPTIRNKPNAVVRVPYGEVATVACEAKGEPPPKITWLSPTNKLIPGSSDKYQIYQDGTLLIQKAQRSDSGNYTCVARNTAGEDRKAVWVQVHVQAPRINGIPEALTTVQEVAPAGSRKLIDCRAQGVPAPKVFWAFPEGVVLPAPYFGNRVTIHRNGTLDIKTLRKSDSVQLTCIGRNEGGEAKMIVHLSVLEAAQRPGFHDPVNEKIVAAAGHTISLNCSAFGTPTPTLVWVLPNGTELPGGRQLQRFFHKQDGRLHISGLSSADAGAYRCVARNAAGHAERLVALKVGAPPPPPPEAQKQYRNLVSIVHGETLQLHCAPPGGRQGTRQARFEWTLPNGASLQGIQTRGRTSLWDNGTLTVREASVFDRGTYMCKADTEHGPSVVTFPVIVIAYPPRITSEPTPVIYTRPGSTVKMNCMAMGLPKAEITWELPDRSQLTAGTQARLYGHRFLHPQGSLTIQQVTQRDAGFYKCTAKNILGTDSKTTYIHVY
ncbi:matrix-remodeling-associated protein 5 [Myotis yumanensis]|uniref:matrix-remodeling-associated protein 5 n=1 Tax=Myotis yumanensis TaxID=159337 RepID=UPI0038D50CE3